MMGFDTKFEFGRYICNEEEKSWVWTQSVVLKYCGEKKKTNKLSPP